MPFTCPRCKKTSQHPKDAQHGYCGWCHDFTLAAAILDINEEAVKRGKLPMWTIFNKPTDHPTGHIARCFEYDQPTKHAITGELETLRDCLSQCGLVCLTRNEGDHPSVVETWT